LFPIFINAQGNYNFKNVDAIALKLNANSLQLDSLALHLTGTFTGDAQKARSIFSWVAYHVEYDVSAINKNTVNNTSQHPVEVLKKRKAVCEGYANLVKALCDLSGLQCYVVYGIGAVDNHPLPHAWNVVSIDGRWQLMDATWAAGGVNDRLKVFRKKFNDEWFFTNPEKFVLTHYPEDVMWQLLHEPIAKSSFLRKDNTPFENFFMFKDTIASFLTIFEFDSITALQQQLQRILRYDAINTIARNNLRLLTGFSEYKKIDEANNLADEASKELNKIVLIVNDAKRKRKPSLLNDKEKMIFYALAECQRKLKQGIHIYKSIDLALIKNSSQTVELNIKSMQGNLSQSIAMEAYLKNYFNTPLSKRITAL
jgi:hypothetical protein